MKNDNEADSTTSDNHTLNSADAIVIIRGQKEDDFTYSKTAAMQVCPSAAFCYCPMEWFVCRHGYLVMRCMMFLLFFVKTPLSYLPVQKRSTI